MLVFGRLVRNADGTPLFYVEIAPELFFLAMAGAVVSGLVAAFVPARRAAALDPAQAIRM
jgi:lipoprotein-releasing system permease protein